MIAVWIPVTVVSRSSATVAIAVFMTVVSRAMTNCPAASVSSTRPVAAPAFCPALTATSHPPDAVTWRAGPHRAPHRHRASCPAAPPSVAGRGYGQGMDRRGSLERRMLLNAALAAGVTGALIALAGCVFATFVGLPPSPQVLAAVVAGAALGLACAAGVAVARSPRARRALGLGERRPPTRG